MKRGVAPTPLSFLNKLVAGGFVDVHEPDLRALAHKAFDAGRPDPRSPSGDENDFVLEAGVDGEANCHDFPIAISW